MGSNRNNWWWWRKNDAEVCPVVKLIP